MKALAASPRGFRTASTHCMAMQCVDAVLKPRGDAASAFTRFLRQFLDRLRAKRSQPVPSSQKDLVSTGKATQSCAQVRRTPEDRSHRFQGTEHLGHAVQRPR